MSVFHNFLRTFVNKLKKWIVQKKNKKKYWKFMKKINLKKPKNIKLIIWAILKKFVKNKKPQKTLNKNIWVEKLLIIKHKWSFRTLIFKINKLMMMIINWVYLGNFLQRLELFTKDNDDLSKFAWKKYFI
jgi:hypothetical protein